MKISSLVVQLFSIILVTTSFSAPCQPSQEQIEFARLNSICILNIQKQKLLYANKAKEFKDKEFIQIFKEMYDHCNSVINQEKQTALSAEAWIHKMYEEVVALSQDDETRNCFNQTMHQLKKLAHAKNQKEKDDIQKSFFQGIETCSHAYAQKVSLDHLEAQVERWENNKEHVTYDFEIWKTLLKHSPKKQTDFDADLKKIYQHHVTKISFEDFTGNINSMLARLEHNQSGRPCLQDIVQFKTMYDAAQTDQEKETLKKDFAIPYYQCKQL